ncbi:MAG: hypothetical protein A2W01_00595 [Candidatus Solincola sediminis]|nr:MAG: hypothetical protein A2W01_00595 [Candidatus Solincola sediminis]
MAGDNCPACGLPRILNRKLVWTTDGGLYFQSKRSDRLIFLEEEDIASVIDESLKLRGQGLLENLRERRRVFSREEVAGQIGGAQAFLVRHWPAARRVILSALRDAAFFGCGKITIMDIKPRKRLEIKIAHPYHPHLMAGDIWGFWEGLYDVHSEVSMEALSEKEWILKITTVDKSGWKIPKAQRPPRPKRDFGLEVCDKCRCPIFPWPLSWDEELGTIYQIGGHRHMVVTSARGWQAVIDEIKGPGAKDLPEAIGASLAAKAASEYRQLKGNNYKRAYRHFFLGLPFLGWGRPRKVSRKPFLIEAEMEGVLFPQLLSWKMAGVFEALEDEPGEILHERIGTTSWKFMLGPKLEGQFLEIERLKPHGDGVGYPRALTPF